MLFMSCFFFFFLVGLGIVDAKFRVPCVENPHLLKVPTFEILHEETGN